ncbi:MAG: pilus assembly protein PilM [Anaerostipes sp.]|nr:pilus assembly protein PilM [Anaerostipes sp.]
MRTSVYLSNRNLQIAIGDTKSKKVVLERLYSIDIQEGNLINGVITNQEGLKRQLEEIWTKYDIPRKAVEITVDSTQIASKVLTIPKMNEKNTYELIQNEFTNIDNPSKYLYDYRVISTDKKGKSARILAAAVNRTLIQSYLDLFQEMDIEVTCVDISQNGILKALELNEKHSHEHFITSILDGDNLVNTLIIDGEYKLFERNRMFNEHGSREFAVEVGKNLSSLLQFLSSEDKDKKIENIYIGGFEKKDQEECQDVLNSLGLHMVKNYDAVGYKMPSKNQMISSYDLGSGSNEVLHYLFCVGNLISFKKDINFAGRIIIQEKQPKDDNIMIMAFAVVTGLLVLISVGIFAFNIYQQSRLDDCNTYLENQKNSERFEEGTKLQRDVVKKSSDIQQLTKVQKVLDSYPDADVQVEREMEKCAKSKVSIAFISYDAATGDYQFSAAARNVTVIYDFINNLEKTKLFAYLKYSGYNYTDTTKKYDIKVTGSLSENAGK